MSIKAMDILSAISSKIEWRLRPLLLSRPSQLKPTGHLEWPIIVVGFFSTASGVGQSARMCRRGLHESGIDAGAIDLSPHFGQADMEVSIKSEGLPSTEHGTLIIHVNPPEFERALFLIRFYRRKGWRVIGFWVWELPTLPKEWSRVARYVSEIWTPSEFVTDVFKTVFACPVKTVPHAIYLPEKEVLPDSEEQDQRVSFLALADGRSSLARKGVLEAVEVFQAAFPKGASHKLTVKCRNLDFASARAMRLRELIEKDNRITLVEASLSAKEQWRLLERHDVILSLHRSEGFGLVLAEAMALGKVVIATGWSGNMTFMTAENSIPLPFILEAVEDDAGIYSKAGGAKWAKPDMEAAILASQRVANDPALRQQLGERARQDLRDLNGKAYSDALRAC